MREILNQYELFNFLPPGELAILAKNSLLKDYKKGDYVCHEGEAAANFHIVVSGKIKVVKHTSFGKDVILDIFTKNETFLVEPLFDDDSYPASAVAAEDSTILLIEKRTLLKFMERYPKMMRVMLKEFSHKMRELNTQIKDLSVGKVDYRIANRMLKLVDKVGQWSGGQVRVDIQLSRQDIADLAGTTIETAIRTMSRFAKDHVLQTTKDSIVILDPDRLEDIAAG